MEIDYYNPFLIRTIHKYMVENGGCHRYFRIGLNNCSKIDYSNGFPASSMTSTYGMIREILENCCHATENLSLRRLRKYENKNQVNSGYAIITRNKRFLLGKRLYEIRTEDEFKVILGKNDIPLFDGRTGIYKKIAHLYDWYSLSKK